MAARGQRRCSSERNHPPGHRRALDRYYAKDQDQFADSLLQKFVDTSVDFTETLGRATRRRAEQSEEVRHELELAREKNEADLKLRSQQQEFLRAQRAADSRLRVEMEHLAAEQQETHL